MANGDASYSAGVIAKSIETLEKRVQILGDAHHGLRKQCQEITSQFESDVRILQRDAEHATLEAIARVTSARPSVIDDLEKRLRAIEDALRDLGTKRRTVGEIWQLGWSIFGPIGIALALAWLRMRPTP